MTAFFQGLLTATAVGALLTLVLVALTPLVGRRFTPQWRHWAWLFVALRLAVPVHIALPQAPIQLPALPDGDAALLGVVFFQSPSGIPLPPGGGDPASPTGAGPAAPQIPAVVARPFDWQTPLLALWAAGAVGFLAVQGVSYAALRRRVRRRGYYVEDYEGLPVWACPDLPSPVLMGFVRPKILLPPGLTGEVRRFALLHEATHHQRRDLWFKLLLVWCNALHWFNPAIWLFRRTAAGDLELACDAALLRGRDEDYRRAYGAALVDRAAAGGRGSALTSAFSGTRGSLRRRVIALLDMRPRRAGWLALCLLCGAALLGGSLVAYQHWSAPASTGEETIQAAVYLDETGIGIQVPPTALVYAPIHTIDPETKTGYYTGADTQTLAGFTRLPIAEDARYPGFPTTLPNSEVQMHPGKVLRMQQLLSAQYRALFPAVLTVRDGVVTSLAPLEGVEKLVPTGGEFTVALSYIDEDAGLIQGYLFDAGQPTLGAPLSLPYREDVTVTDESGAVMPLHALAFSLHTRSSLGPAATLIMEDGAVSAVEVIPWPQAAEDGGTAGGDTFLDSFQPESLTAVWMKPQEGSSWWRLQLGYSFLGTPPAELGRNDLEYELEFPENSPLIELMGINPYSGQLIGTSISFLAGRNSMTEVEFDRLLSGDTACTLVVTSPENGRQRRFSLEVSPGLTRGWALLLGYDREQKTLLLDPIEEFTGGDGLYVYNERSESSAYHLTPDASLAGEGLGGTEDLPGLVYRPESAAPYLLHYQLAGTGQVDFLTAYPLLGVTQTAWVGGLEGDALTVYFSDQALQPDLAHPSRLPLAPGALEDPEALGEQLAQLTLVPATLSIAAGQITQVFFS